MEALCRVDGNYNNLPKRIYCQSQAVECYACESELPVEGADYGGDEPSVGPKLLRAWVEIAEFTLSTYRDVVLWRRVLRTGWFGRSAKHVATPFHWEDFIKEFEFNEFFQSALLVRAVREGRNFICKGAIFALKGGVLLLGDLPEITQMLREKAVGNLVVSIKDVRTKSSPSDLDPCFER